MADVDSDPVPPLQSSVIRCRGVRTHNLRSVDVDIPLYKWTAVTGVSGSGKSSLVFDTLYAEAQRRFLETLGTYERQFLQGLPQGVFEELLEVPAAIALKQSNRSSDPRSLVGTSADVLEPMRLLFLSLMDPSCNKCGTAVQMHERADLARYLLAGQSSLPASFALSVRVPWPKETKKRKELIQSLKIEGYTRVVIEDRLLDIEEDLAALSAWAGEELELVLDRLGGGLSGEELDNRLETIWSQVRFSPRFSGLQVARLRDRDTREKDVQLFRVQAYCPRCQMQTAVIQPGDLDSHSVLGACPECRGMGNVPIIDAEKVIPDPRLSLEEGVVKPWQSPSYLWMQDWLMRACRANGLKTKTAWEDLDAETRAWIWTGADPDGKYKLPKGESVSVLGFFQALEAERYKSGSRIMLAKYRKYVTCGACEGLRVGEAGRNASVQGTRFVDLLVQEIGQTDSWIRALEADPKVNRKLSPIREIYEEVRRKLGLLAKLGMASTALSRRSRTLSGGEYQRVLLTRVVGNGLTDALYVLDEPSVGLGKEEIPHLVDCLRELRDQGNTVVMVEHDAALIAAADHWIEMGPGGGSQGGTLVDAGKGRMPASAEGKSARLAAPKVKSRPVPDEEVFERKNALLLRGFSHLNCTALDLEIPFGKMTVVTGPSGAGKSTLVTCGLEAALDHLEETGRSANKNANVDECIGTWNDLAVPKGFFGERDVLKVEQRALHRTITSVPATVLGTMDQLRKIFSLLPESKSRGLGPSSFSFNGEGACVTCEGKGVVKEDLFFLGEVEKVCPECLGRRYAPEPLEVKWKGKSISDWLQTSISDASLAFVSQGGLADTLRFACELGIGYLPLGVPTTSISGGEAQRLRIAAALSKSGRKLFCILDEPTRGLSEIDVSNLLATLLQLTNSGHTFVVVEHHEQFQRHAHQLVRLGPGGGINGGRITERELRF